MSHFCSSLSAAFHVQFLDSLIYWGLKYGNVPILLFHFCSWNNFIRRIFHSSLQLPNATVHIGKAWYFPFITPLFKVMYGSLSSSKEDQPFYLMIRNFFKLWTQRFKHIWWVSDCGSQSPKWTQMTPASWNSHSCIVLFQIVQGLACVMNKLQQKWQYVTSEIRL